MKATLVLCLGNRLMGDDGVACHVGERLATDPALHGDTDVVVGETDVLRFADRLKGRRRVVVVDAALHDAIPGTVSILDPHHLEPGSGRLAHSLSPAETLEILRVVGALEPRTTLTLLTIAIPSVHVGDGLSPALAKALPNVTQRVRELIADGA